MIIIHGDNTVLSRKKLAEQIDLAKKSGQSITRVEAKKLSEAKLEELLGRDSLFGEGKAIVIEGIHSLPTSKKKKALIEKLAKSETNLILYEKKLLTKTMLKKFPQAKDFEFKISNTLWSLLDALGQEPSRTTLLKLNHALEQNDSFFIFTMVCRQIRLLIQVKDGGKVNGAPFMIQKLNRQAKNFSLSKLVQIHAKLFEIDQKQKTSSGSFDLAQELDLLLLKM